MPRWCASSSSSHEVLDGAELGQHRAEVADVVAAVAQRRVVERRQPQAVDAQPLQVVELLGQPAQVAGAVPVGVGERPDQYLVEHRALEPVVVDVQRAGVAEVVGRGLDQLVVGIRIRCGRARRHGAGRSCGGGVAGHGRVALLPGGMRTGREHTRAVAPDVGRTRATCRDDRESVAAVHTRFGAARTGRSSPRSAEAARSGRPSPVGSRSRLRISDGQLGRCPLDLDLEPLLVRLQRAPEWTAARSSSAAGMKWSVRAAIRRPMTSGRPTMCTKST